MTDTATITASVRHRFSASAERVFDAFLDVNLACRFMFATPDGEIVRAEIDPRVGGRWVFVDRRDGVDVVHHGEYLEIERPHRLAFTFLVDDSDTSIVRIEITPLESGCELHLSNEMDAQWADYLERTEDGWSAILTAADALLS